MGAKSSKKPTAKKPAGPEVKKTTPRVAVVTSAQKGDPNLVTVSLGGETEYATVDTWNAVADRLHKKHGGVPKVVFVNAPAKAPEPAQPMAIVPKPVAPVVLAAAPEIKGGEMDDEGRARSEEDFAEAEKQGFAPKQTVYTRGKRVIDLGVDNAREARLEFDKKPSVSGYCDDLIKRIAEEDRRDVTALVSDLRMTDAGSVVLTTGETVAVEERAFPALVSKLNMPGGFAAALSSVWPEMRAMNVNTWCKQWSEDEAEFASDAKRDNEDAPPASTMVLRTRNAHPVRSAFAAVTESYTAFDVDKIAEAVRLATPEGARGTVTYDGYKARFEVLFHTNVQPKNFVAGEFFRGGVIIGTDDTGGGSLWGNAVMFQNLCLNLIVIDEAKQDLFRIRHIGDVKELAAKFKAAFAAGLTKLKHFTDAWGFAASENIMAAVPKGLSIAEALPGLFNGIIERELVPVRGRRPEAVKRLVQAWGEDKSSATVQHRGMTRAAIANAFTRYAHEAPQPNVWVEDEIQRAAGALVYSKTPLPYLKIEET